MIPAVVRSPDGTITVETFGSAKVEYDHRTDTFRVVTSYEDDDPRMEGTRMAVSKEEFESDPIAALTKFFESGINFGLDSMVDILNPTPATTP